MSVQIPILFRHFYFAIVVIVTITLSSDKTYILTNQSGTSAFSVHDIISVFNTFLSYALKNEANQRSGKPLHIVRYPTRSKLCSYVPKMAPKLPGQRRESFLHKVKIVLETWEVNKKLMNNSGFSSTLSMRGTN